MLFDGVMIRTATIMVQYCGLVKLMTMMMIVDDDDDDDDFKFFPAF